MNGRHLMSCKKNDSIMLYSEKNGPRDLFLAPKDFCGYIPLINSSHDKAANCNSLKVILEGSVRIIVYTIRAIEKD